MREKGRGQRGGSDWAGKKEMQGGQRLILEKNWELHEKQLWWGNMRRRRRDMAGVSFIWWLRMLTHSRKWKIMESVWKCMGAFSSSLWAHAHAYRHLHTSHVMWSISNKLFLSPLVQEVLVPWFQHMIVLLGLTCIVQMIWYQIKIRHHRQCFLKMGEILQRTPFHMLASTLAKNLHSVYVLHLVWLVANLLLFTIYPLTVETFINPIFQTEAVHLFSFH